MYFLKKMWKTGTSPVKCIFVKSKGKNKNRTLGTNAGVRFFMYEKLVFRLSSHLAEYVVIELVGLLGRCA